nr:MAG TPA: hypothetical protein [Caudoviricetes sp.]
MACINCKNGDSGCCKMRAMDVVTPLATIRNGDRNYCFTSITDKICENLMNDEGIHPSATHSNTDCDDLKALNDLSTGSLHNALMALDLCDVDAYKCWLDSLLNWQWNVDKAIICAICGLWKIVHCLDEKTQQSVRTVKLWSGDKNVFELPSMSISEPLDSFDYLDLHLVLGTEHVVGRISLEGGLGGVPTTVLVDKIAANTTYKIAPGAIAAKEIGLKFPNQKTVAVDHFIWSISGSSAMTLDVVNPGVFVAFSNTAKTKAYNDSQDIAGDKPHKILMIEGIISGETGSCFE